MILQQDPETGYWTKFNKDLYLSNVHDSVDCEGRGCAIHNHPSDHPLKDAPLNWRADRNILERICECGIGHDDYDSVMYLMSIYPEQKYIGTHGCCGHC